MLLSPFRYGRLNLFRSYQGASSHLLVLHKLTTVPVLPLRRTAIEDCTSSDVPTSFYFKWPCLRAHSFDASSFARITALLEYPVKVFASNRSLLFLKRHSYRRVIIQVKALKWQWRATTEGLKRRRNRRGKTITCSIVSRQ